MPLPSPSSFAEVTATFGDIRGYIQADGTLSSAWEALKIRRVKLPASVVYAYDKALRITRVTCHALITETVSMMYQEMYDAGLWEALGPYGGGFVYRPNRNNAAVISLHAWGLAWDWNPVGFPNGSAEKRNPKLVKIAAKHGMRWGQDFNHPDPMHLSFSHGSVG